MSQLWGFDLDMSAVRLMRREAGQWHEVAVEKIDGPDIEERLQALVAQTSPGAPVELFLPREQILYTDIALPDGVENAQEQIEAAMDGRTPYDIEELEIDWVRTSPDAVRVAAIARDTLDEATAFAEARGLRVAGFSSLADEEEFPRLPDFGGAPGLFEAEPPEVEAPREVSEVPVAEAVKAEEVAPPVEEKPSPPVMEEAAPPVEAGSAPDALVLESAAEVVEPEVVEDASAIEKVVAELKSDRVAVEKAEPLTLSAAQAVPEISEAQPAFVRSHSVPRAERMVAGDAPVVEVDNAEPVMRVSTPVVPPLNPGPPLNLNAGPPRVRTDIAAGTVSNRVASLTPPKSTPVEVRRDTTNPFRLLTIFAVAALATVAVAVLVWTLLPLRPGSSGMSTEVPTVVAPRENAAVDVPTTTEPEEATVELAAPLEPETSIVAGIAVPRRQQALPPASNADTDIPSDIAALPTVQRGLTFPNVDGEAPLAPAPRSLRALEAIDGAPIATIAEVAATRAAFSPLAVVNATTSAALEQGPEADSLIVTPVVLSDGPSGVSSDLLRSVALGPVDPAPDAPVTPATSRASVQTASLSTLIETDAPGAVIPEQVAPPKTQFGLILSDIAAVLPRTAPQARPRDEQEAEAPVSTDAEGAPVAAEAEPVEAEAASIAAAVEPIDGQDAPISAQIEATETQPVDGEDTSTTAQAEPVQAEDTPVLAETPVESAKSEQETYLAQFRPTPRPVSEQAEVANNTTIDDAEISSAVDQAVAVALAPRSRPADFGATVAAALVEREAARAAAEAARAASFATPDTSSAVEAALSTTIEPAPRPEVVQPRVQAPSISIPSSASVSRQATLENAIRLNRINLIGVYGVPSDRRALLRLPSGKFVKVKVGDRVDGGTVGRISDSELQYRKGGRTLSLTMPQG